jgi:hypothetical protein
MFDGFIVRSHLYEDKGSSVPLKILHHLNDKMTSVIARFTEGRHACISLFGDNYTYFWTLWTVGNQEVCLAQIA